MIFLAALSSVTSWFWIDLLQSLRWLICQEESHSLKCTHDDRFFCFQLPLESLWEKKTKILQMVIQLNTKCYPFYCYFWSIKEQNFKQQLPRVKEAAKNVMKLYLAWNSIHLYSKELMLAACCIVPKDAHQITYCERVPSFCWLTLHSASKLSCK